MNRTEQSRAIVGIISGSAAQILTLLLWLAAYLPGKKADRGLSIVTEMSPPSIPPSSPSNGAPCHLWDRVELPVCHMVGFI